MNAHARAAQILLWCFVIALGVLIGGAVYETLVITPLWAGSPPESVRGWNADPRYAILPVKFWGIFTPLVTLLALLALISGWRTTPARRRWLLAAALCFGASVLSTALFFVPTIVELLAQKGAGLSAAEITSKAQQWVAFNWLRLAAVAAAWLASLRALSIPPAAQPRGKRVSILDEDEFTLPGAMPAGAGTSAARAREGGTMKLRNNVFQVVAAAALACALGGAAGVRAQSSSVFSAGLKAPSKVVLTGRGNLLVAEAGNGPNTGRLSLVERKTGARRTILDGLPAGPNLEGGTSGPSGLALRGQTLFMTIGQGDAVVRGPVQGSEKPNPNPSSPIFSSVLSVRASANVETSTEAFPALTAADHATLKGGGEVVLSNATGDTLTIRLIADFPDYVPNPRPDFQENVRVSNPFGVAVSGDLLYVVDASLNLVKEVGAASGSAATLAAFAPIPRPSPATPPGGPFVEAVPDSVRLLGDQLFVSLLTGFPFQPGLAEVRKVDIVSGSQETFIKGLTSAIDVLPVKVLGGEKFFVLEFSANMLAQPSQPGRLLFFESPSAAPAVVAAPLISPTSMARDHKTGDIFVTEIFTGRVMRVDGARMFVRQHYLDFLKREPDAEGWNFWQGQITQCGSDEACRDRKRVDVSRAFYYSGELIAAHPELAADRRGTPEYNRAFVKQAYLTYLQRSCDPETCDAEGFNFWVGVLSGKAPNTDADYGEMIRAFIVSGEYRARLGLQ